MSVTATRLIRDSYGDLGVLGLDEGLDAGLAQDALRRLNALINTWRTQSLTVLTIERHVFPIVANKQTYTIGPGGDFNVPRPQSINGAGLWLNALGAPVAVTSITRSGTVATVTQTAHGYTVGQEVFLTGADQAAYTDLQTVETVPTANTWTFAIDAQPVTPATGTIRAQRETGQPVEIPRGVLTDDSYQAIQIKTLTNSLFTDVYYNPTAWPFGTVFLWPCPTTNQNQLVLYLQSQFEGFADLTTAYDFPSTPGYQEALQYNLDVRLARPSGVPLASIPDLVALARETLGTVKRQNYRISDLPTDPALTSSRRGGYNINTGTGSGAS